MEACLTHASKGEGLTTTDCGEMAERIRRIDWSTTPLGPVEAWPQSLKTALEIVLSSRYAMFVWWGKELINLYNDAYRPFLGKKHPQALGRPAQEVWAEIWDLVGPRADAVFARAESTFDEAMLLILDRFGHLEETYFTFSYSPVRNDQGEISGLFCAVTEETQRIIDERRLRLLREVAASFSKAHTPEQVCAVAAECICRNPRDLPFALLYLTERDGKAARLVAEAGIDAGSPGAERLVDLATPAQWPFAEAAENELVVVEDLSARFEHLPIGSWDRAPQCAVVVALREQSQTGIAGFLIAGLNPYLLFEDDYRGFITWLAGQISSGMANARAYQEERRRAEALAELDRAKTTFFSDISHELRTPLTLMLGPLEEALVDPQLRAIERERLTVAHRNSLRLLKLVNSLLDFSRIEAGRVQAVYEPTDLSVATSELASVFRSAVEKAGLNLIVDCPAISEPAFVDREMWEKMVLNLISNAFKFTFEGEIEVKLRTAAGQYELAVRDTGTGIPADELPRLFERFHRVAGARGRTYEGSGIGLALVQELVKLHGGSVSVESVYGKGSTFKVAIPLGRSHLPAEQIGAVRRQASTALGATPFVDEARRWLPDAGCEHEGVIEDIAVAGRPERASGERARILLADDNADMRNYVRRLLAPRYEVEAVGDGEAALAAIARTKPDLVLSDIMMPRLDGLQLLARLRADPRTNTLPIILLSARAGEESRVEGMQAGADDYLIKPFSARELLARVEAHVKLARYRQEAEQALRQSEQRSRWLASIVESSDDAIISTNLTGIITSWNKGAERVYGHTAEEAVGKSVTILIPPDRHGEERTILERIRRGERIDHYETVRQRKHGSLILVSLTVSPVKNAEGRIVGASKVARDITEQRRIERELVESRIAHMAYHDALTDLPNRVFLRERLAKELTYVGRGGQLAVLSLDLDHFKTVNDTLGHSTGDELLKAAANRLRGCLRHTDFIARLGGDEFAIVQTPLEHLTAAAMLAQRLRDEMIRAPFELNGHQIVVDISIGIALAPNDGIDADRLLKCADMALHGAKSEGRAAYRYFELEMDARIKARRALEMDLRNVLMKGELELYYQPIVNLKSDEVSGCEALLRWHHPTRGFISPAEFIPVAEDTGLMIPIGEWVLRKACTDAATWPGDVKVAVNVSPVQLRHETWAQVVVRTLEATGLPPNRLELEITESVLMQNSDATLSTLHQLRELGVRIAMDDFGTGYSSLSYLRSFPCDKIKIDRSFVDDLSNSMNSLKIVQAVAHLASGLNMVTTAEGVATEWQLEMVRAAGCTEVQGYLFSPPRPVEEILPLISSRTGGVVSAA
jgi:diguanylate cyclase (GGDEF)-like protein/PAS domain S-box-containing protein